MATQPVPDGVGARRGSVSALLVTWNSARALPGLLETLDPGEVDELVHVDNASADESPSIVSAWPGRVRQQVNPGNLGFASALRQAAAEATGDYLLVVNPDVRFPHGAISALASRLDGEPGLAAAGPKLLRADGSVNLFCARRLPGWPSALLGPLGALRLLAGSPVDPYTFPRASYEVERDVPCLSGAAMLVRRSALESAGGVDDRWFMYFEDIDLCSRLGRVGRIRYCPTAAAQHLGAEGSARTPTLETWLAVHLEGAVNLFLRLHRGPAVAAAHRGAVLAGGVARLAAAAVVLPRSRSAAAGSARRGIALARWAAAGTMPPGAPHPQDAR